MEVGTSTYFEQEDTQEILYPSKLHCCVVSTREADGNKPGLWVTLEVLDGMAQAPNGQWMRTPDVGAIVGAFISAAYTTGLHGFAIATGMVTKEFIQKCKESGQAITYQFENSESKQLMVEFKKNEYQGNISYRAEKFLPMDAKSCGKWHRNWKMAGQTPPAGYVAPPPFNPSAAAASPAASSQQPKADIAAAASAADLFD